VQAGEDKAKRHQVFKLLRIEPSVTKYVRLWGVSNGCGQKHHSALPAGVPNRQLGPRALARVGTLARQFHQKPRKVQDVLSHSMGTHFMDTVSQAHGLVSQALVAPVVQLSAELQHAPMCAADETRHQSHGYAVWLWVLVGDWGARFRIDPSCAQLAPKLILGERPGFSTFSDRCACCSYLPIEQRQVCRAHLLHDFERIAVRAILGGRVGRRLPGFGCLLFRWRTAQKPAQHFEWLRKRIQIKLELRSTQTQCSRTANTCTNLIRIWPAPWSGTRNPMVPPPNNAAERALRDFSIKRKLSYCTRSKRGMDFIETIFSTVQTCKTQGREAYEFATKRCRVGAPSCGPPALCSNTPTFAIPTSEARRAVGRFTVL
jgi:transposase